MFTGCGMASVQDHYLKRDSVRPHTALEVTQVQMEVGVTPDSCPSYPGQPYSSFGQPSTVTSVPTHMQTIAMPTPAPAIQMGQGGFKKVCRTEEDSPCPFPGLAPGVLEMRVKEGSKIRNLMGFAMTRMQGERAERGGGETGGGLRQVVFSGSGRAVTKTITCAEIMKRKVGSLHQLTKLRYKGVREVWESQQGGASEMTVHRTVPSISILLSKDPLDPQEPGYQPPETMCALWEEKEPAEFIPITCKRPLDTLSLSSFPNSKRVCLGEGSLSSICHPR